MSEQYDLRFGGVKRLYGADATDVLKRSHVCVIGIGGVGTWVAEGFARTGYGEITLIDMDDVCVTNTNRQAHALVGTVGQSKTEVMADRLKAINPECKVNTIEDFVTRETVGEYITRDFDYVVDAIDGVSSKAAIVAHCKRNKIKVICIGGAGGQIDPTMVTTGTETIANISSMARGDTWARSMTTPLSTIFWIILRPIGVSGPFSRPCAEPESLVSKK